MSAIAEEKSLLFGVRIVRLHRYLKNEKHEFELASQILRAGTSIGANLAEAKCAISKKDFYAKIYIALKECSETLFWLELLYRSDVITKKEYASLVKDCAELKKILMATTKTISIELISVKEVGSDEL